MNMKIPKGQDATLSVQEESIREKFESFPDKIQSSLLQLRDFVREVAKECDLGSIDESLEWGELSYSVKGGSPIRIGWRTKSPDEYCVFFHCQTTLVETFKEIYGDLFAYEGKRAIVLELSKPVPVKELKHCISLALRYHKRKHLPLLGAFSAE